MSRDSRPPDLLPLRRMAARAGVPSDWLRDQAEAGNIPGLKAGNRWLFVTDVVLDSVRAMAGGPAAQGQEMSGIDFRSLGSFQVPGGRLVVADPCYLNDKDFSVAIGNARPGRWVAWAEIGPRLHPVADWPQGLVASLFVCHGSYSVRDAISDRDLTFKVSVDSGRVCVADSKSIDRYEDAIFNPGFECDPFGVMVPSGIGDGIYLCRVRELVGEAVSVEVRFIDSEVPDADAP